MRARVSVKVRVRVRVKVKLIRGRIRLIRRRGEFGLA